jgi:hypothetical protein
MGGRSVSIQSDGEHIGTTVLEAVADHKSMNKQKLDPPLHEVINLDALDNLFRGNKGVARFTYLDCTVSVTHDGVVTVRGEECN